MSDKKVWSDHDGVCDSFSLSVFSLLDVCGSLFTPECVRPVWAAQGSYHKIGYRSGARSAQSALSNHTPVLLVT